MSPLNRTRLFIIGIRFTNCTGSRRGLVSRRLVYKQFGDPLKVVEMEECAVQPLGSCDVLVQMLAAPVNPVDINIIQGRYPIKPPLPSVPGNEGVGTVLEVGNCVSDLCPGNKVIIRGVANGSWRDIAVFHNDILRRVPDGLGLAEAATLAINPCTAYRMLTDFKPVREKCLVVIQNGANSGCGQNVIQLCKAWGIQTVNVVRKRKDLFELKKYLQTLGATHVLTEEELKTTKIFKDKIIERPTLALNCVGGKNSSQIIKYLQKSSVMVTYGGMSRNPVSIPTGAFIFRNISFVGFWMTGWNKKSDTTNKDKYEMMMTEIIDLMCAEKLRAPVHKMVKFDQFKDALRNTLTPKGFAGYKYILDFRSK